MTGDVVLAGASLSLSGSLSVQGEQAHRGLKLWATSAGADGIVVGGAKRPVELVVFDDESKPARARPLRSCSKTALRFCLGPTAARSRPS